jgi:fumarylpyruvate hydrolase
VQHPYAFEPPAVVSIAIAGSAARFPVRRVYCIGRNYEAHVREMGHDPSRSPPIFFCKPADAVVEVVGDSEAAFAYPSETANCHHEIELVVAIGKIGRDIPRKQAAGHIFGYAVGLDMTRRDLQQAAARAGQPWETGKAFDASAPMGPIHPIETTGVLATGTIALEVNGEQRQQADLAQLIWSVDEIVAALSRLFELRPGDLIFSGTPEGVGAVAKGDLMTGRIDRLGEIRVRVN